MGPFCSCKDPQVSSQLTAFSPFTAPMIPPSSSHPRLRALLSDGTEPSGALKIVRVALRRSRLLLHMLTSSVLHWEINPTALSEIPPNLPPSGLHSSGQVSRQVFVSAGRKAYVYKTREALLR